MAASKTSSGNWESTDLGCVSVENGASCSFVGDDTDNPPQCDGNGNCQPAADGDDAQISFRMTWTEEGGSADSNRLIL